MTDRRNEDIGGETSYKQVFCQSCGLEITSTKNIAAERFHGRLGGATLYKTAINVTVMNTERRELLSGVYDVADVTCRNCSKVIGWYYYQVSNKTNEWKIGKYCLEDELASVNPVYKTFPAEIMSSSAKPLNPVSSMMHMMSPAAVVNAVVRSSSKMMSSSRDDDDDTDDDEENDAVEEDDDGCQVESESSDEDDDDLSVCSTSGRKDEDVADDDDDDESSPDDESEQEEDVDEWEVVELIEMTA